MKKINKWLQDSDLFKNSEESKLKPNAILSIIIFFSLWGGALFLGRLVVIPLINLLPNNTAYWISFTSSLRKIFICGFQIIVFFAWVKLVEKRKITTMGFICKHKLKAYFKGLFLGFGSITVISLVLMALGAIEVNFNNLLPINLLINTMCIAVFGWIVQSASEEIAIRGWLIPTLGIRYNPLVAILLTGGVFGIIHLLNNGVTVLTLVNLTLSGFFFALYAINEGNIWGVCGLHLGWNFVLGSIFGLRISGEKSNDNSLFISHNLGTDILTGGDFGPEGCIITTFFLICVIIFMGFIFYKKHKTRSI